MARPLWTNQYWPEGYYNHKYNDNSDTVKETENSNEEESEDLEEEIITPEETKSEEATTVAIATKEQTIPEKSSFGLDYYNQLTDKQKRAYIQIKEGCEKYQEKISFDAVEVKDYEIVLYALKCDHPEFYWLNYSGKYMQKNKKVYKHIFKFDDDPKITSEKIKAEANTIVEKVNKEKSTYDKIRCIHNELIKLVKYKRNKRDQEIRSVFLDKETVCNGYAEAFLYLCKLCNINCGYARGRSLNESHAWNIVEINGKYFWVDVTWDGSDSNDNNRDKLNYVYFCVSDKRFKKTHKLATGIDVKGSENIVKFSYPKCLSDKYNYYRKIGGYFNNYNKKDIKKYIKNKVANSNTVELMFKSKDDYQKAKRDLCTGTVLWDMMRDDIQSYKYINDDKNYYLMFIIKK